MNREQWLTHAVEVINSHVFNGDLDILNHKFQINCGICPGTKLSTTIQPSDGEDIKLEDFFPTTISIDHKIKDPLEILAVLARECVFAFFNENRINKRSKKLLEKYYFDAPYSSCNPSPHLEDILKDVYKVMVELYGEFPGTPVVIHPKDKKEGKKNNIIMFCPSCGYEIKVARKMFEKHGSGTCTCVCGCKMGVDCGDEKEED